MPNYDGYVAKADGLAEVDAFSYLDKSQEKLRWQYN